MLIYVPQEQSVLDHFFTEYLKKELRPIYENGFSCTTPWMQYFMDDTSKEVPCSQDDARTQFENVTTVLSKLLSQNGKL